MSVSMDFSLEESLWKELCKELDKDSNKVVLWIVLGRVVFGREQCYLEDDDDHDDNVEDQDVEHDDDHDEDYDDHHHIGPISDSITGLSLGLQANWWRCQGFVKMLWEILWKDEDAKGSLENWPSTIYGCCMQGCTRTNILAGIWLCVSIWCFTARSVDQNQIKNLKQGCKPNQNQIQKARMHWTADDLWHL